MPGDAEALSRYIERAGRPPAIAHFFRRWTHEPGLDAPAIALARQAGALPMLTWEPWQGLEPIVRGECDRQIRDFAAAIAAGGEPLFLRFAHEMNLPQIPWYGAPATFRDAWARVRAIFDEADTRNVIWVWSPYVEADGLEALRPWFPGPELVDWPALDGYNWGRRRRWQRWPSFEQIFGASLAALREVMPGAPVMLAEIGCAARSGDKAAWMRETLLDAIPEQHPEIRAVVWFDEHRPEHADWRIDSSPESLAAWRAAAADPRYGLGGTELRNLGSG